jgi:type II secretion system protein I
MTLFEVLLALAIFAGAAAAIGQLLASGVRGALHARAQTEAVLRCESKLAEVIAGAQGFQSTSDAPFPDDPNWSWSLSISNAQQQNLLIVEVTTKYKGASEGGDVTFSLHRLMRNPQTLFNAVAASALAAANAAASNSATPSTSSSSTGTGASSPGGSR